MLSPTCFGYGSWSISSGLAVVGSGVSTNIGEKWVGTGEEFQVRARTARLDQFGLLIGLATVLTFARDDDVLLSPPGSQRARISSANPEQDSFLVTAVSANNGGHRRFAYLVDS